MSYEKFFKDARLSKEPRNSKVKFEMGGKPPAKIKRPTATPEESLKRNLTNRLIEKRKAKKQREVKLPSLSLVCITVALGFSSVGYFFPESLDYLSKHVDIRFFSSSLAKEDVVPESNKKEESKGSKESAQEKPAAGNGKAEEKNAGKAEVVQGEEVPDIKQWSAEELSFFNKLNDRKKELDQREAELNKLDEELQKQKVELEAKLRQLDAMRIQISSTLKTKVTSDQEKIEKLVQFYSTMKATQAAKIIEAMNEDLAIEILDRMKKKNAAEIMNVLDAKKAQHLSEMLAGYRRPASAEKQ